MKLYSLAYLLLLVTSIHATDSVYTIKIFTEKETHQFASFIIEQRCINFSQFPYLYKPNMEYERELFYECFGKTKDDAIAVAFHNDQPVGFLTGSSLGLFNDMNPWVYEVFKKEGLMPESFYYFGEVIVLPEHRNHGLAHQLFVQLEQYAHSIGYNNYSLLVVLREYDHPLKPIDYKSPNSIWTRLDYKQSLIAPFEWETYQTDGSAKFVTNMIQFWIKEVH